MAMRMFAAVFIVDAGENKMWIRSETKFHRQSCPMRVEFAFEDPHPLFPLLIREDPLIATVYSLHKET